MTPKRSKRTGQYMKSGRRVRRNPAANWQVIEAKVAEYRRKAHTAEQNAERALARGNRAAVERYMKQMINNRDRMRAWQAKLG